MENMQITQQERLYVRTQLRAGLSTPGIKTFTQFATDFIGNMSGRCPTSKLTEALNTTNESCKQLNQNGRQCDDWAAKFGIPYAKG